jgi:hypothetical protein
MGEAVSTFYHSANYLASPVTSFISAHGSMVAEAFLIGKTTAVLASLAVCRRSKTWKGEGLVEVGGVAVARRIYRVGSSLGEGCGPGHAGSPTLTEPRTDPPSVPSHTLVVPARSPATKLLALASLLGCTGPAHRRSRICSDFLGAAVSWLKMTMMLFRLTTVFCH